MTINHVVILTFSQVLEQSEQIELLEGCLRMRDRIPLIMKFQCGFEIGSSGNKGQSFCISAEFEALEDYKAYAIHPAHIDFVDLFVKPRLADNGRRAIQYET
jgi:hypothetical protein